MPMMPDVWRGYGRRPFPEGIIAIGPCFIIYIRKNVWATGGSAYLSALAVKLVVQHTNDDSGAEICILKGLT